MKNAWATLTLATCLCAFAVVFSEWLFFATKPSFLSVTSSGGKLVVMLAAAFPVLVAGLAVLLPLWLLAQLGPRVDRVVRAIACVFPSVLLGGLSVLMADNFTTTVFQRGMFSLVRGVGLVYFAAGLVVAALTYRALYRYANANPPRGSLRAQGVAIVALVLVSAGSLLLVSRPPTLAAQEVESVGRTPNILLLGFDGVNANNMSAYGYARDTTPNLERWLNRGLVCENNFSNAAHTGSSIASMLTGTLPTRNKLIHPPDILSDEFAYRHLPGILRELGYYTMDSSVRHFADPYDLNIRAGFDEANGRSLPNTRAARSMTRLLGQPSVYLLEQTIDRVSQRTARVFQGAQHVSPMDEVREADSKGVNDPTRLANLIQFLRDAPDQGRTPFFVHAHFMRTHGPRFASPNPVYSVGVEQSADWMRDYYDDAIRENDAVFARIMDELENTNLADNTVVILHSDHGMNYQTRDRLPLVFFFPGGEHRGRIGVNTQNLDIAPTILDYLGSTVPDWMSGQSLLRDEPDPRRPIFAVRRTRHTRFEGERRLVDDTKVSAPFYSLGGVRMTVCHRTYLLTLDQRRLVAAEIRRHTAPCELSQVPTPVEAGGLIVDHLRDMGYDVSSLRPPFRIENH